MNYLEWPLCDIFCCHTNFFVLCTIVIRTCKVVTLGQKTIESVTKEIKYLTPLFNNNIRKYRHWRRMTWNTAVTVDTASCVTHLLGQRFCFAQVCVSGVLCKACCLPSDVSCSIMSRDFCPSMVVTRMSSCCIENLDVAFELLVLVLVVVICDLQL